MMRNVVFVTGNANKAAHFSHQMGAEIAHAPAELDEIQTIDHRELVEHKVRQAYAQIGKPVLVEDVFFSFEAWGNLPGPFVKFFVEAEDGVEKMCRMLDGFTNRRAAASCVFGYYDGEQLEFFESSLSGEITDYPKGEGGYGFDRIFAPDGFDGKTAAEIDVAAYDRYYALVKPFQKVREFLAK